MSFETDLIEIFWEERDALFRYASKILEDPHDAEDALHDCYLSLASKPGSAAEIKQRRAWVFKVVRNLCIDRLRTRRRRANITFDPDIAQHLHIAGSQMVTPEQSLLSSDELKRAYESMRRLPPEEAQTLTLAVVEGLSYADISFITDVPVGTVRSRLNRARRMLRGLLDNSDADNPHSNFNPGDTR